MFKTFLFCFVLGIFLWFICEITLFYITSPKGFKDRVVYKPYGFWHKVFLDFPRQLGKDLARADKNVFTSHGIVLFEGKQGAGKTISAVRYISLLKARFPECKVYSNTQLIFQDGCLDDWKPLMSVNNGIFGVACLLDEISIWFNNRLWKGNSKNGIGGFPPQMLQVITQQRKRKMTIIGTCQSANLCDKQIRIQANYFVKCFTLFGCLTFNHWRVPEWDSEGNLVSMRHKKLEFFVQSDFLRSCYDTYATISSLDKIGMVVPDEVRLND